MAAYTVNYQAPQYGSAASEIGAKISGAMDSAAQKRKEIDDEIAALEEKKEQRGGQLNDEDSARLQDLLTFKESNSTPGSLAVSQMISDFGGDKLRRTMGFFQKNPADENDPALDKKQRFDALINKTMKPQTTRQLEIDGDTVDDNTKLALSKLTQFIADSVNGITDKVRGLKESDGKVAKIQLETNNNVEEIQRHFAKNNEVQKVSNVIQQDLFNQTIQNADDRENDEIEARGEAGGPATGSQSYSWGREGGKSTLSSIFDIGKSLLGFGGGNKARPTSNQYSGQIGPQPMNSRGPWSSAGPGEFGNAAGNVPRMPARVNMSQGGVVANNTYNDRSRVFKAASGAVLSGPSSLPEMKKMSGGGMVDSPTLIPSNSAVIPKDTMTQSVKQNPENQKKAGPFAKLIQLPTLLAGSMMTSIAGSVFSKGGMSKLFRPVLRKFIAPAAMAFGIPSAVALSAIGGSPSQAAPGGGSAGGGGGDPMKAMKGMMSKFKGAMGMNQTQGMTNAMSPGGSVTNAQPVSGYTAISGFGMRQHPITGAWKQHDGIDYSIPQGKLISLKKGGEVTEVKAPDTSGSVSGIVRVTHPDGTESRYVHLSEVMVRKGQQVSSGDAVGKVGGEPGLPGGGGSTGAHLHWEYYPSTSARPADGSGVAGQYFQVGGQLNATPPSATPQAQTPQRTASSLSSGATPSPFLMPLPGQTGPQPSLLNQNTFSSQFLSIYNFESPYTPTLP